MEPRRRQMASPYIARTTNRRAQALALRREAFTYERIGEFLGISKSGAVKLVLNALRDQKAEIAESVDELRALENERLDKMTRILMRRMQKPDANVEAAVNAMLRVMQRRADMNGLDAPKNFRIIPSGESNPAPDLDMSKMSMADLLELEELQTRYHAIASRNAIQLPPGDPVATIPLPEPETPDDGSVDEPIAD